MRGEQLELERIATAARREAGLAPDDFADAVQVAHANVGNGCIVYDPELACPAYLRRREDGSHEIVLKPGAPDTRFRILHEVGHVLVDRFGLRFSPTDEERAANYIAAAIMAPAALMRRAYRYFGNDFAQIRPIAKTFGLSPTSADLRIAEVVGGDRGVATASGNVIVPNYMATQTRFPWHSAASRSGRRGTDRDATVRNIVEKARERGLRAYAGLIDDERISVRLK